jgi:hypothetical protein
MMWDRGAQDVILWGTGSQGQDVGSVVAPAHGYRGARCIRLAGRRLGTQASEDGERDKVGAYVDDDVGREDVRGGGMGTEVGDKDGAGSEKDVTEKWVRQRVDSYNFFYKKMMQHDRWNWCFNIVDRVEKEIEFLTRTFGYSITQVQKQILNPFLSTSKERVNWKNISSYTLIFYLSLFWSYELKQGD